MLRCCFGIISIRTGQKYTLPILAEVKLLWLGSNSSVLALTKLLKSYWADGSHFLSGFIFPYIKQRDSQLLNWLPLCLFSVRLQTFCWTYSVCIIEINTWRQWEHETSRSLVSRTRLCLQWNWKGLASYVYRLTIGFRSVCELRMRSDFLYKLILP